MGLQPTTERGRQTRQRIVAAAAEVVAEKGALGASLDEVGAAPPHLAASSTTTSTTRPT
jgi:TetR/AcrR family transcriptional repressor of nem operon